MKKTEWRSSVLQKTDEIKGSKIEDVIGDKEIAKAFKDNIKAALENDMLVTHKFLFYFRRRSGL